MFLPLVYAATVALLSLHSFASASPLVARAGQGAWNPPITAPQAGDVWTVGSTQLVTWDISQIPPHAAGNTGTLLLGYFDGYTQNENLDVSRPLAHGFPLTDGCVRVEVPDVIPRDTYIVVLMGNSANASPEFTITNSGSTSVTTHSSSDNVVAQGDSNDFDPKQLPPDFPTPVSPLASLIPDPPFSDPKIDLIETEPLPEDSPAPASCMERFPSSQSGNASSRSRDPVSGEGPNKHR